MKLQLVMNISSWDVVIKTWIGFAVPPAHYYKCTICVVLYKPFVQLSDVHILTCADLPLICDHSYIRQNQDKVP